MNALAILLIIGGICVAVFFAICRFNDYKRKK